MPLPAAFVEGMQPGDKFVLAFPRSGSRWLRLMLEDMHRLAGGEAMEGYGEKALLHETGAGRRPADARPVDSSPADGRLSLMPDAHGQPRERSLLLTMRQAPIYRSRERLEALAGPVLAAARAAADADMAQHAGFDDVQGV